jgi:hypothetical protein
MGSHVPGASSLLYHFGGNSVRYGSGKAGNLAGIKLFGIPVVTPGNAGEAQGRMSVAVVVSIDRD